jgi:hypothetical protein
VEELKEIENTLSQDSQCLGELVDMKNHNTKYNRD